MPAATGTATASASLAEWRETVKGMILPHHFISKELSEP
jgi:hypothetical protein